MFKKQQPKYIIEFQIDFNLSEVANWLKEGGNIKNLGKEEPHWYGKVIEDWRSPLLNSYIIDVVPSSLGIDSYYHRRAGRITNNIGGIDYLGNAPEHIRNFCEENDIHKFEWSLWRQYISVSVNDKLALIAPLDKFVELQVNQTLSLDSFIGDAIKKGNLKLDVPVSFNDDGAVKETIPVWHGTASSKSIGYLNDIVSISGHTLNFEVGY